MQPGFLICAAVLALSAGGMSIAIKTLGLYLTKEPLPLKKSLNLLNEKSLGHYKVLSKEKIENEEIVKSLGTEDYIQWKLEDIDAAVDSAVRYCMLFITYYGLPDRVPHVPDECYTGSGYQRLSSEGVTFKIGKDDKEAKIPGRYIVFTDTSSDYKRLTGSPEFPVLYLFNVNGDYAGSRENARIALNKNIFGRYSYFSKVEWKFFNPLTAGVIYPDREKAITASQQLLSVILPVLEKEHWPDWEKRR
jgi:hypothetical protein